MCTAIVQPATEADIWVRKLYADCELKPKVAHDLLGLSFPYPENAQMCELSAKVRAVALTPSEGQKMDAFERASAILSTLKFRA